MTYKNSSNKNRRRQTSILVNLRDLLIAGMGSVSPSLDTAAQASLGVTLRENDF